MNKGSIGEDAADALVDQARERCAAGDLLEARSLLMGSLAQHPTHYRTLMELGELLRRTDYRSAARLTFQEAARHHPTQAAAHLALGHMDREEEEWQAARRHYEAALAIQPDLAPAHQGLSYVLQELGESEQARNHRDRGFGRDPWFSLPYRGAAKPLTVLLLVSAVGGNIPVESILDNAQFRVHVVAVDYWQPASGLPAHDVVFNAIGDADVAESSLQAAKSVVDFSGRPVVNPLERIRETGRQQVMERIRGLSGVRTARMIPMSRDELLLPRVGEHLLAQGFRCPFLLRAVGYHTGRHFVSIDDLGQIRSALSQMPGYSFWVIERLDTAHADGTFRKFRIMMVDGKLWPLHCAISNQWKVHYYTALMDVPEYQDMESAFLGNMSDFLGTDALARLESIQEVLGLDYGGIDFDIVETGEVMLFEANATMVIPSLQHIPAHTPRHQAVLAIQSRAQDMLRRRAGIGSR